jgi:hypothetical protein
MPAVFIIEKYGMRMSLLMACVISIVGTWISLLVDTFAVKILG